jgi:membrane protease YdiL (CAAX protease family)
MAELRPATIGLFVLLLFLGIAHPNLTGDLLLPFSLFVPVSLVLLYRIALIAALLAVTYLLRRDMRYHRYWPVACSFLIFSVALFLDWYLTITFGSPSPTPAGIALAMVLSTVKIVLPVVVLVKLAGFSLSSVYLKKGNLKLGLTIGLIGFLFFLALPFLVGNTLFYGGKVDLTMAAPLLPWALIFALFNGLREELLYRGLFLGSFEPLFGRRASNLLQCLIFTWSHTPVTYASNIVAFVAILFVLGLVYGYLIQRTGGLWGSILVHAGGDLSIFLGMFSNL